MPENVLLRHLWTGHVGGMHAVYVGQVQQLQQGAKLQLQQYGDYMSKLQHRETPDATAALLLPYSHAYTPYAPALGSNNSMWHPQPPSPTVASIFESP